MTLSNLKAWDRVAVRWLRSCRFVAAALAVFFALALSGRDAHAESFIKQPGTHHKYAVEVEPHVLLGWYGGYGVGFGGGARVGINIVKDGFIKSLNNSVAISFGIDYAHYNACYGAADCGIGYLFFPVTMQWNFYLTPKWSVFGEPGFAIYHAFYEDLCGGFDCGVTSTSVIPVFGAGGRFHFSENLALTMRIGWPSITVGLSIW